MSKLNIEDVVKNKLENFEFNYDNSWNEFEKKLNKSKISYTKYYISAIAAAIVTSILYFSFTDNNLNNNNIKHTNIATIIKTHKAKTQKETLINNSNSNKEIKQQQVTKNNDTKIITITKVPKKQNTEKQKSNTNTEKQYIEKVSEKQNIEKQINQKIEIIADFITDKTTSCGPCNISFTPNNYKNVKYIWNFGDGKTSTNEKPKHKYKKPGEYSVELIIKSTIDNKTIKKVKKHLIKIYPVPKIIFNMSNADNIYYFDGPDNYTNIKWKINSKTFSTETDPEYEFKTIGKSKVTLAIEDENHCKASYTETVDIQPVFQIANAFSPDNNNDNDEFGPIFEYPENYKYFLYVYDGYGKLVFNSIEENTNWNGKNIKTNNICSAGLYVWKLLIKDKYGNKIIKKGQVTLINNK